ncbi:MAG: polysaccharide biosynthesis C-terminal domain-containing protein [Flavobacteriales bacterium]
MWYKLTDRTKTGGTIAIIGAAITIAFNFALIPNVLGYMGSAWATLACYAGMAIISYIWGQKHYPIPYNVSRVLLYMAGAVVLWWGCEQLGLSGAIDYTVRASALLTFLVIAFRCERTTLRPLSAATAATAHQVHCQQGQASAPGGRHCPQRWHGPSRQPRRTYNASLG